ncbi:uracil-DNA glycosylase [Snodgrassella sp. CFCC 13594]|uniref:uracil-DNA glycosylase n=1 Tax=Snodgrassella sp. CFCC 13594 TaxID=1775559 RepID=UPI00082AE94F|nr:uracil-DNA glycosylase [Snodgrassella sp. CFCC 13594]
MLSTRYLYLHEALELGPMWLQQSAHIQATNAATGHSAKHANQAASTPAKTTTEAMGSDAAASPSVSSTRIEAQPARHHVQQILQQLGQSARNPATVHTATSTPTPAELQRQSTNAATQPAQANHLPAAIATCTACALHAERRQPIWGQGTSQATLMVISPNPAPADDDAQQLFSGDVGRLLHNMLAAIGVDESQVFYTSEVKCTPNVSLHIAPASIEACRPYLQQQLATVQPRAILLLGQAFTRIPAEQLAIQCNHLPYVIMPHPARLLRQSHLKAQAWDALRQLASYLNQA